MKMPWNQIVALWIIGILAAAQLAKFAVLSPMLGERFGLSLPEGGLLISLLEVGGALFGLAAGLILGRLGARRILVSGLAFLAITGAIEAFASDIVTLFIARSVEGIGYLLVVIAAPTLVIAVAGERKRSAALALWSTFVPVGMALGSAITGMLVTALGTIGTFLVWSAASLAAVPVALSLPDLRDNALKGIALPNAAAWFATLGFGCYTTFISALIGLLPTYLIAAPGSTLGSASLATGVVALSALPGAAIAFLLLRGARDAARRAAQVMIVVLLGTGAVAPLTFGGGSNPFHWASTMAAIGVVTLSGVASAIIFARLPVLAGANSDHDPRIAAANGLVTQFGAGGALIGPPLGAIVVEAWGWTGMGGRNFNSHGRDVDPRPRR